MTPHQAIAVAVRLFAVWLAVRVFREVLAFSFDASSPHATWIALGVSIVAAAIVLALWFFPRTVAHKLLSSPVAESPPSASPDMWLAMGCALIGLWLLTTTLPGLIRYSLVVYFSSGSGDTSNLKSWLPYSFAEVLIAF
jgi:divalent metal cation (Fe/Co/Zn/Cd) transporter